MGVRLCRLRPCHRAGLSGHPGTPFGKKAPGCIVYFGGKKNTDAAMADCFGDLFHFEAAEITIWNARRAAAGMLERTMRYIMEELKRATFLGIGETRYSVNGKSEYAWVVRTDRAALDRMRNPPLTAINLDQARSRATSNA